MRIETLDFSIDLIKGSGCMRSDGLHLTDIIRSIQVAMDKADDSATEEQLQWYRTMGFVWERVVEQGIALAGQSDRYVRPGELVLDGIIGTPDLFDTIDHVVIDTKCLFKSSSKLDELPLHFWKWLAQLKGYCKMQGWLVAELWVMPICGNWKPPMIGAPVRKRLTFTQVEVNDNWDMLVKHAKEEGML